jgi:hypothetical protein
MRALALAGARTMRPLHLLAIPCLVAALAGCRNPCQRLCDDMRDFAEDCGFEVSKDEFKSCLDAQSSKNTEREKRQVCADTRGALEAEWTCDDVADYFTDPVGADTGA